VARPKPKHDERAEELARLGRFVGDLQDKNFFGRMTVSIQNGRILDVRTEQVHKMDELE
jgi:hypothetical protein